MITYEDFLDPKSRKLSTRVKLDGKTVGVIRQVIKERIAYWQYAPTGHKGGELFASLYQCQKSLE